MYDLLQKNVRYYIDILFDSVYGMNHDSTKKKKTHTHTREEQIIIRFFFLFACIYSFVSDESFTDCLRREKEETRRKKK